MPLPDTSMPDEQLEAEYLDVVREAVHYRNEIEFALKEDDPKPRLEQALIRGRQTFKDEGDARAGRWSGTDKTECGINANEGG